jgi:hypothetical protein
MKGAPAGQVVPLLQPADLRQAKYYKRVLDEQRAQVDEQIADHYVALAKFQASGDLRGIHRLSQTIRKKQREQFELHRLRGALEHRFFPARATQATPMRCFDIEITRDGARWRVYIPEIDGLTKARHRGEAEMIAREHIALSLGKPIAEVAVQVLGGHSDWADPASPTWNS